MVGVEKCSKSPFLFFEKVGPRFAEPGGFEFEYGAKWKALYEMKKQKLQALEREMKLEEDKLIAQVNKLLTLCTISVTTFLVRLYLKT